MIGCSPLLQPRRWRKRLRNQCHLLKVPHVVTIWSLVEPSEISWEVLHQSLQPCGRKREPQPLCPLSKMARARGSERSRRKCGIRLCGNSTLVVSVCVHQNSQSATIPPKDTTRGQGRQTGETHARSRTTFDPHSRTRGASCFLILLQYRFGAQCYIQPATEK